jgi:hypothetical protein
MINGNSLGVNLRRREDPLIGIGRSQAQRGGGRRSKCWYRIRSAPQKIDCLRARAIFLLLCLLIHSLLFCGV